MLKYKKSLMAVLVMSMVSSFSYSQNIYFVKDKDVLVGVNVDAEAKMSDLVGKKIQIEGGFLSANVITKKLTQVDSIIIKDKGFLGGGMKNLHLSGAVLDVTINKRLEIALENGFITEDESNQLKTAYQHLVKKVDKGTMVEYIDKYWLQDNFNLLKKYIPALTASFNAEGLKVSKGISLTNDSSMVFGGILTVQDKLEVDSTSSFILYTNNMFDELNEGGRGALVLNNGGDIHGEIFVGSNPIYKEYYVTGPGGAPLNDESNKKFEKLKASPLILNTGVLNYYSNQSYDGDTQIKGGEFHLHNVKLQNSKVEISSGAKVFTHGNSSLETVENNGELYVGNAGKQDKSYGITTINSDYNGGKNSKIYIGSIDTVHYGEEKNPLSINGLSNSNVHDGYKNLLVIKGNAQGFSSLVINNVANINAERITPKGILLVNVEGDSYLTLKLEHTVSSGGTDYLLNGRKNLNSLEEGLNSWYLSNSKNVLMQDPIIAPQVGAYLANLIASNEMFKHQYSDRQYFDGHNGLWGGLTGSFMKYQTNFGNEIDSKLDYYTLRLGYDLWENENLTVGIMGAYGHSTGNSKSNFTGFKADHSSQAFGLGGYLNYVINEDGYVDTWAQYVHSRNKVERSGLANERYNSKGLILSLETGYHLLLNESFSLVPQAQVVWMNVKADNHTDSSNTKISANKGNFQTRIGARLNYEGEYFIPYMGLNYLHNSKAYTVKFADQVENNIAASLVGAKNIYQVELGVVTKPQNGWEVTGAISYAKGKDSYKNTRVKLEVKYQL